MSKNQKRSQRLGGIENNAYSNHEMHGSIMNGGTHNAGFRCGDWVSKIVEDGIGKEGVTTPNKQIALETRK